jgi:hypothetical protein
MHRKREMADVVLLILRLEAQRFFAEARHLVIVLIAVACIPAALAWQLSSPLIAAAAVGVILAERWIMDMFDQKGREFVKFSIYPLSWELIVLGKEMVAIVVAVGGGTVAAVIYSWFHLSPPSWAEAFRGLVAYLCILIPVVQVGGSASVTELQQPFHTPLDMVVRAVMCLIATALSGIPVLVLLSLSDSLLPLGFYLGLLCTVWYAFGIRMVADKIRQWQTSPDYIV